MNSQLHKHDWSLEDQEIAEESSELVTLLNENKSEPEIPTALDKRIRNLAAPGHSVDDVASNWLIGQGPWVVLVTCILFIVTLMILTIR